MKLSILGFGHMAKAMVQRLNPDATYQIKVASPSLSIGKTTTGIDTHHLNSAIIADADVILLAVKPLHMEAVLAEINAGLTQNQLLISVAAGLTLNWYSQHVPPKTPIVRAIPNLAASIGQSATPLMANEFVTSKQRHLAEAIFNTCGIITWVQQENELNAYTALSGSGPAYVFKFMNAMVTAAVALGLSEETATTFAIQTVKGAVNLAATQDKSLLELQTAVTSKGGTTAAALSVFQQHDLDQVVFLAMKAALERSKEL